MYYMHGVNQISTLWVNSFKMFSYFDLLTTNDLWTQQETKVHPHTKYKVHPPYITLLPAKVSHTHYHHHLTGSSCLWQGIKTKKNKQINIAFIKIKWMNRSKIGTDQKQLSCVLTRILLHNIYDQDIHTHCAFFCALCNSMRLSSYENIYEV